MAVVSQMDGRSHQVDIQAEFIRRHGTLLFSDDLDRLIHQLDEAHFLVGPTIDAHMAELTRAYREQPHRPLRAEDSLPAPPDKLGAYFDTMLGTAQPRRPAQNGQLLGLVSPHLDYPRGRPCYAAAYRDLPDRTNATRFVILGTNHFGRSTAVVGTRQDFETPFGVVPQDGEFLQQLEERCAADLCEMEYDHAREHSVELQVILLRHLLQNRPLSIVSFLCPDPCGPTGTAPGDGRGVDLKNFAAALLATIQADPAPTCIIAAADLSHVGRFFNDPRELDTASLQAVEQTDRQALHHLTNLDPESFRATIAAAQNPSNICSAGCLYILTTIMKDRAKPHLLQYHQALTSEIHNCVTCAAMEFTAT